MAPSLSTGVKKTFVGNVLVQSGRVEVFYTVLSKI
jgi:hypothetical protein